MPGSGCRAGPRAKESTVTDQPARIERPLDDDERNLLRRLAIRVVAEQSGSDEQTAAAALDTFTEKGEAVIRGDAVNVYLDVAGHTIVHATREWLAFHAHHHD